MEGQLMTYLHEDAMKLDDEKFQVIIDLKQFAPEDISITTYDKTVSLIAKQKKDSNSRVTRLYISRCKVPEAYDIKKVETKLFADGVLTVTAPKHIII